MWELPDPSLLSSLHLLTTLQTLLLTSACVPSPGLSVPDLAQSLPSLLASIFPRDGGQLSRILSCLCWEILDVLSA